MEQIDQSTFKSIASLHFKDSPAYKQYYTANDRPGDWLTFSEIEFTEPISLPKSHDNVHFKFVRCKLFSIKAEDQQFFSLFLQDCKIDSLIITNSILRSLHIESKRTKIKKIVINGGKILDTFIQIKTERLEILDYISQSTFTIDREVDLFQLNNSKSLIVHNSAPIKKFQSNASNYPFTNPVYIGEVEVENGDINRKITGVFNSLKFIDCTNRLTFLRVICLGDFTVRGQRLANSAVISVTDIYIKGKAAFSDCKHDLQFEITRNVDSFVIINDLEISDHNNILRFTNNGKAHAFMVNRLTLTNVTCRESFDFEIQSLKCHQFTFNNFKSHGKANIDNVKAGQFYSTNLTFDEASDKYKERFEKMHQFVIEPEGKKEDEIHVLQMYESDFGKMNFINCDFSNFELNFFSSKIIEIFIGGSKMPTKVRSIMWNQTKSQSLLQQQIANSQLKKVHEQQGDMVGANHYFANEMNAYYSSLSWKTDKAEIINLSLNKFSSNHGQSWAQALLVTVLVSLLLYTLFLGSLGYYLTQPNETSMHVFGHTASFYFEFLNPVHKLESFNEIYTEKFTVWSRVLDAFSRIFISYFIYQLIQAFRKHGRYK